MKSRRHHARTVRCFHLEDGHGTILANEVCIIHTISATRSDMNDLEVRTHSMSS